MQNIIHVACAERSGIPWTNKYNQDSMNYLNKIDVPCLMFVRLDFDLLITVNDQIDWRCHPRVSSKDTIPLWSSVGF